MKWISVKVRYPDTEEDILIWRNGEHGGPVVGAYTSASGKFYDMTEAGFVVLNNVTHWAHFSPPKIK